MTHTATNQETDICRSIDLLCISMVLVDQRPFSANTVTGLVKRQTIAFRGIFGSLVFRNEFFSIDHYRLSSRVPRIRAQRLFYSISDR